MSNSNRGDIPFLCTFIKEIIQYGRDWRADVAEKQADAEKERADAEKERANIAEKQANAEKERADAMESQLEELRKKLAELEAKKQKEIIKLMRKTTQTKEVKEMGYYTITGCGTPFFSIFRSK